MVELLLISSAVVVGVLVACSPAPKTAAGWVGKALRKAFAGGGVKVSRSETNVRVGCVCNETHHHHYHYPPPELPPPKG